MNTDFAGNQIAAQERLQEIQKGWITSPKSLELATQIDIVLANVEPLSASKPSKRNFPIVLMTLVHRSFIKSYRDVVAYGIRIAMYTGLAIMMGTVWLRLDTDQSSIQPFINAIVSSGPSTIPIFLLTGDLSSSALHSCLSWQLLTYPASLKTELPS
jgi:hypothetical protein